VPHRWNPEESNLGGIKGMTEVAFILVDGKRNRYLLEGMQVEAIQATCGR